MLGSRDEDKRGINWSSLFVKDGQADTRQTKPVESEIAAEAERRFEELELQQGLGNLTTAQSLTSGCY